MLIRLITTGTVFLTFAMTITSVAISEDLHSPETELFADQADWFVGEADEAAVEQVQFGGFRPRLLSRPPLATVTPPRSATPQPAQPRQLFASAPATPQRQRLARAPDMLGDSLLPQPRLIIGQQNGMNDQFVTSSLAVAGGTGRTKIGDHNKPIAMDRVYFNYNHFHNAVQRQVANPFGEVINQTANIDRFTMGTERTLLNGDASLELRLPFTNYPDMDAALPGSGPEGRVVSDTGAVGNLALIGKRLLFNAEDLVVSCGMGIEFPTGADGTLQSGTTLFHLKNEALFLQPFLAASLDNGQEFIHSMVQVDVGLTQNPLLVSDVTRPDSTTGIGEMKNQTLIHWDTSFGRWLARSDDQRGITGIAAVLEFHLTSAVSSSDPLGGSIPTAFGQTNFILAPAANQFTATYVTTGIHTEIGRNRTIRVAGVFPLNDGVNRFFDAEFLVQFGGRY